MKNNLFKYFNRVQIVSFVLLVITYIASFFGENIISRFFVIAFCINLMGFILYIKKWSIPKMTGNRRIDKQAELCKQNKEKCKRELSFTKADFPLFMLAFIYMAYFLVIIGFNLLSKMLYIHITFVVILVINLIAYLLVKFTDKEVSKYLNVK